MRGRAGGAVRAAFVIAALCTFGVRACLAVPITWTLQDVTFQADLAPFVSPGPITATGSFVYDADTHTYSNWNITVAGGTNPNLDRTYTPSNSYVPAIYTTLAFTNVEFVYLAPGLTPTFNGSYPNGTHTSMIALDFHDDPYGSGLSTDPGLTNQGGTFSLLTAITRTYDYSDSTTYGVRTGSLTSSPTAAATPEPSSMVLAGTGVFALIGSMVRRRRV